MSQVTIPLENRGKSIRLPSVCIVCGTSAAKQKRVVFTARFSRGFWITRQSGHRMLYTTVPLCREHWRHFDAYAITGLICIGIFFALILAGAAAAVLLQYPLAILFTGIVGVGVIAALLIITALMRRTMVHANNITKNEVTLTNVSATFARGLHAMHAGDATAVHPEAARRQHSSARHRDDFEDEEWGFADRQKSGAATAIIFWIVGVFLIGIIGTCGIGTTVFFVLLSQTPSAPPGHVGNPPPGFPQPLPQPPPQPQPQPPPPKKKQPLPVDPLTEQPKPLPIDPGWNEAGMQKSYLSDMPEYDARVGWGTFGKNGRLGFPHQRLSMDQNRVVFNGNQYPKAISIHAPTKSYSRVKYRLDGRMKLFRGTAAMADLPKSSGHAHSPSAITFAVLGDGRLLWKSRPLQKKGAGEEFRLGVEGVNELELRAYCPAQGSYTWSVWLDPYVLR